MAHDWDAAVADSQGYRGVLVGLALHSGSGKAPDKEDCAAWVAALSD